MAQCKRDVTALLWHWIYISFAELWSSDPCGARSGSTLVEVMTYHQQFYKRYLSHEQMVNYSNQFENYLVLINKVGGGRWIANRELMKEDSLSTFVTSLGLIRGSSSPLRLGDTDDAMELCSPLNTDGAVEVLVSNVFYRPIGCEDFFLKPFSANQKIICVIFWLVSFDQWVSSDSSQWGLTALKLWCYVQNHLFKISVKSPRRQ